MRAFRTIVATAVIVFTLTTVAMAGVQHLTKHTGQTTGTQAQQAQPTYSVTLTAKQLARLMQGQSKPAVKEDQRHATRHQDDTRVSYRNNSSSSHNGYSSGGGDYGSGSSADRCYDYDHQSDWSCGGSSHSGDCGGGDCW